MNAPMLNIEFRCFDDNDGHLLARALMPCPPRKGETVVMRAIRPLAEEEKAFEDQKTEDVQFVVDDVWYEVDAYCTVGRVTCGDGSSKKGTPKEVDVTVWLALPANEQVWHGAKRS